MIAFCNFWLLENGKANAAIKNWLKKVAKAKKKTHKKLDQAKEKAKSKNQSLEMRKLAIANCSAKFATFKALLSDSSTGNNLFSSESSYTVLSTTSHLPISTAKRV